MTAKTDRQDVYTRITAKIVAAIEAGAERCAMPWHTTGSPIFRPVNVDSGKGYRGINTVALWAEAHAAGFGSGIWGTYKQWAAKGAQVRKGEKAALVVFWKVFDRDEEGPAEPMPAATGQDRDDERRRFMARGYSVFNADQVEGFEAPVPPALPEAQRIAQAERFFAMLGARITEGGNRAFYRPSTDEICMPPFQAFRDAASFYAVLAHEATHWTGSPARLDRDLTGRFGSDSYAAEELVAELGAAFLCSDLGLASEPRPDHASYIGNWLKVLKNDPRAIFTAAAKAQAAADWMHGRQMPDAGEIDEAA